MGVMVRISMAQLGAGADRSSSAAELSVDVHLRACVDAAADRAVREHSDVLYFRRAVSVEEVVAQLRAFPGCAVCAGASADGLVTFAARPGAECPLIVGRLGGGGGSCAAIASLIHALMASGMRFG